MRKISTFISLYISLNCTVLATNSITIHGSVIDKKSRQGLPFANIQILDTYLGTISNVDGKYILKCGQLPAKVKVSYIGYISETITISKFSAVNQNISLNPTVLEFPPITVTGEDPAIKIMRQVIKNKQLWREELDTYQAESYIRFVLENDTGIVSIVENVLDIFWHKKKGISEVIKSTRKTQNLDQNSSKLSNIFLLNLYDDDIGFFGHKLIGPTHPDALDYYIFKLTGERQIDEKIVFDITVTPKNKLQSCFIGRISILDQDFAMIDVDLKMNDSVLFLLPIQKITLQCSQQFANFNSKYWLPMDIRAQGEFQIGMTGLKMPAIKYCQIARLTNYQINVPLNDSLFQKNQGLFAESPNITRDTLLASKSLIVPLSEKEKKAYQHIKESNTIYKAFKPSGFLGRFATEKSDKNQKKKKSNWNYLHNLNFLEKYNLRTKFWYNRVEALHLGLYYKKKLNKSLKMEMYSGYMTGLKKLSYSLDLQHCLFSKSNTYLYLNYFHGTDNMYNSEIYPWPYNSLNTLFGFDDYFDYYWNEKSAIGIKQKFKKLNLKLSSGLNLENISSLSHITNFNILGRDNIQPINPPVSEGKLRSFTLNLQYGEDYIPFGVIGQKRILFKIEKSSKSFLSSDFSFMKYNISVDWRIPTLFKRRFMPNTLDLRLNAGAFMGDIPIQRFGTIDVRSTIFNPFGTVNSLTNRPLIGEKYLSLFWDHNFRTIPFEILGLKWFVHNGIGIILHGASGRTWISDSQLENLNYQINYCDKYVHEIGISVNNIFSFFRLNVTKRLDKPDLFYGCSLSRIF